MFSIVTFILMLVIIAFILISAVIVHLHLGFHRYVMLRHEVKRSEDEARQALHEMIFRSPEQGSESLLESARI